MNKKDRPYHVCLDTMANELRFKIVDLIKDKGMSVTEIGKELEVERSTISHSLQDLKLCKIVTVQKHGKEMIYSLNPKSWVGNKSQENSTTSVISMIDSHIDHHCPSCAKMGRCTGS